MADLRQGFADSHAGTIGQLDNLKLIAIGDIKGIRELNKWLTAVETAVQKNRDCAPEALKTLKWTWKAKRAAHPEEAFVDYGCPTTMDELKDFVANKRFPRCTDVTVAGYMSYYTDGLFKVTTDANGVQTSDFFSKGERPSAPAMKWRTTAFTTRMLFATHIAEDFIVQKVQRGDFENWEDFRKRILMWNSIDALQHEYVRPSEFFNEVKTVVNDSLKTPRKFMLNVQRLESAIRAHAMDKDGSMNTFEGENLQCTAAEDKISPLVWLLIEAIAAVGLDRAKCRVVEDHFCDVAGHDLLPSTVAEYRFKWQQLMQLECSRTRGAMAVRHVAPEPDEVEELEEEELEDAWADVCEKAERICAVRMHRNDGSRKKSQFNPNKFRTLSKTFGKQTQNNGILHMKICWKCANNDLKKNEFVHAAFNCPLNRPAGRGRGRGRGGRGRGRGRINRVGEGEASETLSQADQRDVAAYINDRDGYCSQTPA